MENRLKSIIKIFFASIIILVFFSTGRIFAQRIGNVDFSLNPKVGCSIPHTVSFADSSENPDIWTWNFGDGGSSTSKNPVHTYTSTGTFIVKLTARDTIDGSFDTHLDTVFVSAATFSGDPQSGCGPLTVDFVDASADAVSWEWDFGDGGTSNEQNPSYTYNKPDSYDVTLKITNSIGCEKTLSIADYILVIGPDVNFGIASTTGTLPLTVTFRDSTTVGAPIVGWSWNFGDGGTSTLQNPSHTYNTAGTYNVSLMVTDLDGCSRTLIKNGLVNTGSSVTINQASGQKDPTNSTTINFTAIFSEPVTGFSTGDVTISGTAGATTGTITEIAPNDGTTYNVAVTGVTTDGTVIVSIASGVAVNVGNVINLASTSTDNTVTYGASVPDGSGTSGDPYLIATLDNLYWVTQSTSRWNKHYKQTTDIDASSTNTWDGGAGFTPIGNISTRFTGTYNGDGYTITGLFINRSTTDFVGMFGSTNSSTEIKNLGLIDVDIAGKFTVGGLVGNNGGSITNSYSTGSVSGDLFNIGGLVGSNYGTITKSYSTSSVSVVNANAGGLVGSNYAIITKSYSTGSVSGGSYLGGLVGRIYNGSITNSYSTGSVSGEIYIGGLVGVIEDGSINNSYSTGSVSGGAYEPVGGLVGLINIGSITNCFWDTQNSGQNTSAGGTGKTTAEMKTLTTFLSDGWDFEMETLNGTDNYWDMDNVSQNINNGYPFLSWQNEGATSVSTVAPGISIGSPSTSSTGSGPVIYNITYSGAATIDLTETNVILNTTGSATGTVTVSNGNTYSPTLTISGITGDGTLGITLQAGTSNSINGIVDVGAGPSTTFTVDNTSPTVTISAPSVTVTNSGPVIYNITYSGAAAINLTDGDVTLNKSGTANGTVTVSNGTTTNPIVTVNNISGVGTLGISINAGTSSDASGNLDLGAGPSVTFYLNTAPVITTIDGQTINEDDTLTVNINVTDADRNGLSFSSLSSEDAVKISISNEVLSAVPVPDWHGEANITVEVNDGNETTTISFKLTVLPVNDAPFINSISNVYRNEDESAEVKYTVVDVDGDKITMSGTSSNENVSVEMGGGHLILTPKENWHGTAHITVEASDGDLTSQRTFPFIVSEVNDAPVLSFQLSPFTFNEDEEITFAYSELYPFIEDSDNEDSTLTISFTYGGDNLTIETESDSIVSIKGKENWFGLDTVTVHVSDGSLTTSESFAINVIAVNDAPVINGLPTEINLTSDEEQVINTWSFISDVESEDSLLTCVFSPESDSLTYSYEPSTGALTLSAVLGFAGEVIVEVTVTDPDGGTASTSFMVRVTTTVTGIEDLAGIPTEYEVSQNYPNPFNPSTKIRYGLPGESKVYLVIYNILGQEVAILKNTTQSAGYHEVEWNASRLSSGMYIYRLTAESVNGDKKHTQVKKMLLVK